MLSLFIHDSALLRFAKNAIIIEVLQLIDISYLQNIYRMHDLQLVYIDTLAIPYHPCYTGMGDFS